MLKPEYRRSLFWVKVLAATAVVCLVLFQFVVPGWGFSEWVPSFDRSAKELEEEPSADPVEASPPNEEFVVQPVETALGNGSLLMTNEQCIRMFPENAHDLKRARKYFISQGGISREYLESRAIRQLWGKIINNRLFIKQHERNDAVSRGLAQWHAIHQAIVTSPEPIPDIEFLVSFSDEGIPGTLALSRSFDQEDVFLAPDFGFWSWPEPKVGSWLERREKAFAVSKESEFSQKIPKLLWRGVPLSPIRESLLQYTEGQSWNDVGVINWGNHAENVIPMEDHCQWKYLAHTEGRTYSGRLKYLMMCDSLIIMHNPHFTQHYDHLMISEGPDQNVVVVGEDWEQLNETMEYFLDHDKEAQKIIQRNKQVFANKYMTPAAISCYWRELFRYYSETMTFKPVLEPGDVPYESFILMGTTEWDAH